VTIDVELGKCASYSYHKKTVRNKGDCQKKKVENNLRKGDIVSQTVRRITTNDCWLCSVV
jgi:hypothetical protein